MRRARSWCIALALAAGATAGPAPWGGGIPAAVASPVEAVFVPVGPARLADTRSGEGHTASGPGEITVQVAGRAGVPAGATAAVLTISVDRSAGAGFVTAWAADAPRPLASSLNLARAGQTMSATQVVPLSAAGAVKVALHGGAHGLVVDVTGAFVPAGADARAGRYRPTAGVRLADSRAAGGALAAGEVRRYDPARVLPAGASYSAVVVNLTATETRGPGYLTAWPSGRARPGTASLAVDAAGQTRGALAIVPTSSTFDLTTFAGTHVVVDVLGWFTGDGADAGADGRFVAVAPERWADSRISAGLAQLPPGGTRAAGAPVASAVPPAAAAVWANVTMVDARPGWVVAHADGTAAPPTATTASSRDEPTIGNAAIVPLSSGRYRVTSYDRADVVVDVTGWFTADPRTPSAATAPADPPCRAVPLVAFDAWRAEAGRRALERSATLQASACAWAALLVRSDGRPAVTVTCYDAARGAPPDHQRTSTSTDVHSPFAWRLAAWGLCAGPVEVSSSENVAQGYASAEQALAAWRASAGHHANAVAADARTAAIAEVCGWSPRLARVICWWVAQLSSFTAAQLP